MKYYSFDENGIFNGEVAPQVDPLETEIAGETVYMVAANSTVVAPPAVPEGSVAQWDGSGWVIKADFRGEVVYSISDKSPKIVDYIGDIETGYTNIEPGEYDEWVEGDWVVDTVAHLAGAKLAKLYEINSEADRALSVITDAYPESERLSWDKQEQEARNWLADNSVATPLLDAISSGRGLGKDVLAARVIVKADAFAAESGDVFGKRQAYEDQVALIDDVTGTLGEVDAIVVSY